METITEHRNWTHAEIKRSLLAVMGPREYMHKELYDKVIWDWHDAYL